jgi:hypothetical protein
MNTKGKRSLWVIFVFAWLFLSGLMPAQAASPWMSKSGYGGKTWGKFCFGIKNSLLGWMTPWAEAKNPKYQAQWMGYSAGAGEGLVYTA